MDLKHQHSEVNSPFPFAERSRSMERGLEGKARIGIVLSSVPGYSETFFRNKIKGLQENGYKVILFVDYFKPSDTNSLCEVRVAPSFHKGILKTFINTIKGLLSILFINPKKSLTLYQLDKKDGIAFRNRLKQLVRHQFLLSESLDWLHFGFGTMAIDRENVAKVIGAKMAVSFRGFDLYLSPLKHPDCYEQLFTKQVNYHVLSHKMKVSLMQRNISKDQIFVIPPAIDISFFEYQANQHDQKVMKIVTVARLHWIKGLEYSLQALSLLKEKGIHFEYVIIGSGEEHERLVFAAYQLGLSENVNFLGKVSQAEVKNQLELADIYLQYSIQEGFCNAVLEAQAMGLLCVVSDADGLTENVLHEQTGWVVPKRQPELLARVLEEVSRLQKSEQERIRENAIKRVRNNFNLEQQKAAFVNFYQTIGS